MPSVQELTKIAAKGNVAFPVYDGRATGKVVTRKPSSFGTKESSLPSGQKRA